MKATTPVPRSLEAICEDLLGHEGRIVLGTGCFDIMHVGHVFFLEQASAQGDVLVIGVNSDASVRRLKGTSRPIVGELDRATMVAAVRYVDHVFVYDATEADEQIRALAPDVYVTGSESVEVYPTELMSAKEVGATVHVIGRLPERSTTRMVDDVLRLSRDEAADVS